LRSECATLCSNVRDLGHVVESAAPQIDWDAYSWAIRAAGSSSFAAGIEAAARAAEACAVAEQSRAPDLAVYVEDES